MKHPSEKQVMVPKAWVNQEDLPDPSWRHQAACRDAEPEIFHPPGRYNKPGAFAAAADYCSRCPVAETCLEVALKMARDDGGMWGGLMPSERESVLGHLRPPGQRRNLKFNDDDREVIKMSVELGRERYFRRMES